MSIEATKSKPFIGYEYKEVRVPTEQVSMYMDGYENFGWELDENVSISGGINMTILKLKRDRKIVNRMELTRLQRHFEACMNEIASLERSKNQVATVWALCIGILGTAFMAGSVFAVTAEPPIIWLCILLAIPAFIGWIVPYFLYQYMQEKQTRKVEPFIEEKYSEIYEICEKGHSLL